MNAPDPEGGSPPELVAHFFRHEHGRLVARLARRFGPHHLAAIEDAVQSAMLAALRVWGPRGIPHDPSAWLHRVALNELRSQHRRHGRQARILESRPDGPFEQSALDPAFEGEVSSDLLRMLFVCCDESLPERSRLVLALKTLGGFDVGEIAFRLFTSEASVYKRLARARVRLRVAGPPELPTGDDLQGRLPSVRWVIYLLFNEGYLSIRADQAIRAELCIEAIRLATLVATHPVGADDAPTAALLALMHLHAARLGSRVDPAGELVLLEDQDRATWDPEYLACGLEWLARAQAAEGPSRFHLEAAIAAEHALAPSFAEIDWSRIARYHEQLARLDPSPLHVLNLAVALAEGGRPMRGSRCWRGRSARAGYGATTSGTQCWRTCTGGRGTATEPASMPRPRSTRPRPARFGEPWSDAWAKRSRSS